MTALRRFLSFAFLAFVAIWALGCVKKPYQSERCDVPNKSGCIIEEVLLDGLIAEVRVTLRRDEKWIWNSEVGGHTLKSSSIVQTSASRFAQALCFVAFYLC